MLDTKKIRNSLDKVIHDLNKRGYEFDINSEIVFETRHQESRMRT